MSKNKIWNLYKPLGISSIEFLNLIKRKLEVNKIGHAGTLDPIASGVLIVGTNESTKELSKLVQINKTYIVCMLLGIDTDTNDYTGKIIGTSLNFPSYQDVRQAMSFFINNDYYQVPPIYSAVKVNGISAYKYARNNQSVNLAPRLVKIYHINLLNFELPQIVFELSVSKGFYIRKFAIDFAKKINTLATVQSLVRTKCGDFDLKDSLTLSDL